LSAAYGVQPHEPVKDPAEGRLVADGPPLRDVGVRRELLAARDAANSARVTLTNMAAS
jgi:hypothetical protein